MSEIIDILKKVKAIYSDDHFILTSGRHSAVYINKDALYPHTIETSRVGELFAQKFKDVEVDTVVGPALGGIILSTWTAYHLTKLKGKEIAGVYTEKTPDKNQIFTRGYDGYIKGKNVLVIEDLTATGGSVRKVVDSVLAAGGSVVGVCVMVNRDPVNITSETVGGSFSSLGEFPVVSYDEKDCPMCKSGVPINTTVGHGKKFLESKHVSSP